MQIERRVLEALESERDDHEQARTALEEIVGQQKAEIEALSAHGGAVPDGVWEALQRLIENAQTMGEASREDAVLVASYRDRHRFLGSGIALARRDAEKVRQGRAEALAIIMELDAEEGLDDFISIHPIADTGGYGCCWEKDKLTGLLRADDSVWSLRGEAEDEYWHNLGLREHFEQFRDRLIAEKQAEAVREFAQEVWHELLKSYRNVKVMPLTMAKQWIERRQAEEGS